VTAVAALSSLDSAEALWLSRRPLSYVVVEERFCECGGNPIAINATRRQGASIPSDVEELVRATYAGTDTAVEPQFISRVLTIQQFFALARDALTHGGTDITLQFDPDWAYPSFFSIRSDPLQWPGIVQFRLRDFAILE